MHLVSEAVCKVDNVYLVLCICGELALVGNCLDRTLEVGLCRCGLICVDHLDEALGRGLAAVHLDEHLSALGNLGEVADAVAVEDIVVIHDVGCVDERGARVSYIAEAVHAVSRAAGKSRAEDVIACRSCGGTVADVGSACKNLRLCRIIECACAHDEVCLCRIAGGLKAHEFESYAVVVPVAVAPVDAAGPLEACVVCADLAGDIHLGSLGDGLCRRNISLCKAGAAEDILCGNGLPICIAANKVAVEIAFTVGHHAD